MDPIREKLMSLDQQAALLQKESKYLEALDVFQEMLMIKKSAYGEDSEEYFKTSDKLCELCNQIAMIFLQKEKFEASLEFLKKADLLAQSSQHYKAITYNNLACYYRRTGKLRSAMTYLQQALDIEIKQQTSQSLADTHLNMCAVLSQLGRHQEALEHSLISVVLLQDEFLIKLEGKQAEDRVAVLAIAYHNLGVEFEYLKRFDEAIQTYQKAHKFASSNLPPTHQLITNLKNVLDNAQEQIQSQRQKDQKRKQQKEVQSRQQVKRKVDKMQNIYQQQKMQQTIRSTQQVTLNQRSQDEHIQESSLHDDEQQPAQD